MVTEHLGKQVAASARGAADQTHITPPSTVLLSAHKEWAALGQSSSSYPNYRALICERAEGREGGREGRWRARGGTAARVSAAASAALPRAPQDDAARSRRPRHGTLPHLAGGLARPLGGLFFLFLLASAQSPYPRTRLRYLDPLLVSPAFRHVGRSARFPLTWSEETVETSRECCRGPLCNPPAGGGRGGRGRRRRGAGPRCALRSLCCGNEVSGSHSGGRTWTEEQEVCKEPLVVSRE